MPLDMEIHLDAVCGECLAWRATRFDDNKGTIVLVCRAVYPTVPVRCDGSTTGRREGHTRAIVWVYTIGPSE